MKQSLKIFYWGMLISFLSSLPPGVMNIAGTQIFNGKGASDALLYITGFMITEMLLVRLALAGMNRLTRSKKFFHLLEWMTAGVLVAFSTACFITANQMQDSTVLPDYLLPSFLMGVVISVINPMHIPFWIGWSTVLINKGILSHQPKQYSFYIAGIGMGTMVGFVAFIVGGGAILKTIQSNQYLINCGLGLVLFITAFLHIKKMILVPVAVRHAKLFRRSL